MSIQNNTKEDIDIYVFPETIAIFLYFSVERYRPVNVIWRFCNLQITFIGLFLSTEKYNFYTKKTASTCAISEN